MTAAQRARIEEWTHAIPSASLRACLFGLAIAAVIAVNHKIEVRYPLTAPFALDVRVVEAFWQRMDAQAQQQAARMRSGRGVVPAVPCAPGPMD